MWPSPARSSSRNASEKLWLMPDEPAWDLIFNCLTANFKTSLLPGKPAAGEEFRGQ